MINRRQSIRPANGNVKLSAGARRASQRGDEGERRGVGSREWLQPRTAKTFLSSSLHGVILAPVCNGAPKD